MAFPWLPSSTGTLTTNTCARDIYNLYFLSYRNYSPVLRRKLQAIFLQCCFTSISAFPISWHPVSEKNLGVTLLERVSPFLLSLLWRNCLTSGLYLFDPVGISSYFCCYHEIPDKSYIGGNGLFWLTVWEYCPWLHRSHGCVGLRWTINPMVSKDKTQRTMLSLSSLYPFFFFSFFFVFFDNQDTSLENGTTHSG